MQKSTTTIDNKIFHKCSLAVLRAAIEGRHISKTSLSKRIMANSADFVRSPKIIHPMRPTRPVRQMSNDSYVQRTLLQNAWALNASSPLCHVFEYLAKPEGTIRCGHGYFWR
jgi:hypothetical protein